MINTGARNKYEENCTRTLSSTETDQNSNYGKVTNLKIGIQLAVFESGITV